MIVIKCPKSGIDQDDCGVGHRHVEGRWVCVRLTIGISRIYHLFANLAAGQIGQIAGAGAPSKFQAARTPRVAAVSGGGQSAPIGTLLGAPLVVALLDATGSPIVGQKVFFRVVGNNGSLDGGQRGIALTTDASGHAAAHFTLGAGRRVHSCCGRFARPCFCDTGVCEEL